MMSIIGTHSAPSSWPQKNYRLWSLLPTDVAFYKWITQSSRQKFRPPLNELITVFLRNSRHSADKTSHTVLMSHRVETNKKLKFERNVILKCVKASKIIDFSKAAAFGALTFFFVVKVVLDRELPLDLGLTPENWYGT